MAELRKAASLDMQVRVFGGRRACVWGWGRACGRVCLGVGEGVLTPFPAVDAPSAFLPASLPPVIMHVTPPSNL